jgi:putative flippase GtrA
MIGLLEKHLKRNYDKYKETIMYVVFGALTTIVNLIVYFFCRLLLDSSPLYSNILAWLISVIFAFITNKIYVFKAHSKEIKAIVREFLAFVSCRIFSGVMDTTIIIMFIQLLHYNDLLIKILSNILVLVTNYIFSKYFIFRKRIPTTSNSTNSINTNTTTTTTTTTNNNNNNNTTTKITD